MQHCVLTVSAACLLVAAAFPASAQEKTTDVEITGHIVKPKALTPTDKDIAGLKLPDGFKLETYATGLINPRVLAVSDDGTLYATRRSVGDVIMIQDRDGDGKGETVKTVASRPNMHGIAFHGDTVYLVTIKEIYKAEVKEDGTFGELTRIVDGLPDAGQHADRTIAVGPDDKLYVSVGSTCNACDERNPENATMLRVEPDGSMRTIYASGLRNTIGFAFQPRSGDLYGWDHGIDWLGDDEQPEELNLIRKGKQYGWPYIYGDGGKNPADEPPGEITHEDWAEASETPVLTHTAHAAPMELEFYEANQFPAEYQGDAFVAMHGSWNRKPPSGYEVLRVRFEDGKPVKLEPFVTGFLKETDDGYGYLGRPFGLAVSKEGALFISDDANGAIYKVTFPEDESELVQVGEQVGDVVDDVLDVVTPDTDEETEDTMAETDESGVVTERTDAKHDADLALVTSAFEQEQAIPHKYSAYGQNISPALSWEEGPEGTKSYALLVEDPDAPMDKPFVHWVLFNLPADVTSLEEGLPGAAALEQPDGARQGNNGMGSTGYFGPKPPDEKPHRYYFQLFALDKTLDLGPGADREALMEAIEGHILAQDVLMGTFEKPENAGG
ncbi:YbhB/YbcL family Raf kinase inhibitor-like protein [Methyloligella solikamskensis]|uniref:YbhB/YbcL family Raf kinase inhibitor-like protein n=1 Tax=Methyloligella solikamskensis TaxID=1177756 RepID=A0ABW3J8W9_9HYPH